MSNCPKCRRDVIDEEIARLPQRITRCRREQKVMRTALAAGTGLDISTLKRIERNQPPTIAQLVKIADFLRVAPWSLLGTLRASNVRDRSTVTSVRYGRWGLLHSDTTHTNPVELELAAGASDGFCWHDGDEWLYVVSGTVELHLAGDETPTTLSARDAVDFDASIPHSISNVGAASAVVLRRMTRSGLTEHLHGEAAMSDGSWEDDPESRAPMNDEVLSR